MKIKLKFSDKNPTMLSPACPGLKEAYKAARTTFVLRPLPADSTLVDLMEKWRPVLAARLNEGDLAELESDIGNVLADFERWAREHRPVQPNDFVIIPDEMFQAAAEIGAAREKKKGKRPIRGMGRRKKVQR